MTRVLVVAAHPDDKCLVVVARSPATPMLVIGGSADSRGGATSAAAETQSLYGLR